MKANRKSAVKWAGTSALAVMLATTSAFAAAPQNDREQQDANNRRSGQQAQSSQRAADGIAAAQRQEQLRNSSAQEQRGNRNEQQATQQQARPSDRSWNNGEQARRDQPQYNQQQRNQQRNPQYNQSRGRVEQTTRYRENQRVNVSGRITSYSRERDGYRIHLDRGGSYWIPSSRFRGHERDLRVGINISLGGIFRGGVIGIDAVDWPTGAGYGYDQGYVRGVIERVDYRSGVLTLRDDSTGRLLNVDMRDTVRDNGVDFGDVRPGDFVSLSGQWLRGNIFSAYRIDSVNSARY